METIYEKFLYHVSRLGFKTLTNIQKKAIPVIINKINTLIIAPTGTGKTEAAILPILFHISENKIKGKPSVLYITPLRALNRDLLRRIRKYSEYFNLKTEVRHGDTPTGLRRKIQQNPPDILITTPETLGALLTLPAYIGWFKNLEWVIVDEVHELINSKRGVHLALSLERLEKIRKGFVRIGLSASVGAPDKVKTFLFGLGQKGAVIIDRNARRYIFENIFIDGEMKDVIENIIERIEGEAIRGSIIIFTNTRQMAEYLASIIKTRRPEILLEVHHGSLSREVREQAEKDLREGKVKVVISTSSLELGIDVGTVSLVFQIESPRQVTKLLQRVGRSEHKVSGIAKGIILNNFMDDFIETEAICELVRKDIVEEPSIHYKALDVLAHHIAGLTIAYKTINLEDIIKIAKRTIFYKDLTIEEVFSVLEILSEMGVIRVVNEQVHMGRKSYEYYFSNISMIPDNLQYIVINALNNNRIGSIDYLFINEALEDGKPFILKGTGWSVISIDEQKQIVKVEPRNLSESEIPFWLGEIIPVDYFTAQEVGKLRKNINLRKNIDKFVPLKLMLDTTKNLLGRIPDNECIFIEKRKGGNIFVIHACFGTKVNNTLGILLSTLLSSKLGYKIEYNFDPYRIILNGGYLLTFENILEVLSKEINLKEILAVALRDTNILRIRGWNIAKRFGIIPRDIPYDSKSSLFLLKRYSDTAFYKEVLNEIFVDKFDLERTYNILKRIRDGDIQIFYKELEDFSPLAKIGFKYAIKEVASIYNIDETMLNIVKERLENRRHLLLCLSCGKLEKIIQTKDVDDFIHCNLCGSRLVTIASVQDRKAIEIIRKRALRKKLSKEEEKEYRKLWSISSLIQNFGKKAIFVLSGYGIGPKVAGRILDKKADMTELLNEIYRAEKNFIRTRPFWD
ncbi:MAG: DEAD/DEAH box helicase [Nitrososphaeria archaeon]